MGSVASVNHLWLMGLRLEWHERERERERDTKNRILFPPALIQFSQIFFLACSGRPPSPPPSLRSSYLSNWSLLASTTGWKMCNINANTGGREGREEEEKRVSSKKKGDSIGNCHFVEVQSTPGTCLVKSAQPATVVCRMEAQLQYLHIAHAFLHVLRVLRCWLGEQRCHDVTKVLSCQKCYFFFLLATKSVGEFFWKSFFQYVPRGDCTQHANGIGSTTSTATFFLIRYDG